MMIVFFFMDPKVNYWEIDVIIFFMITDLFCIIADGVPSVIIFNKLVWGVVYVIHINKYIRVF